MSKAPEPGICERLTREADALDALRLRDAPTTCRDAAALIKELEIALRELRAIVRGECPSLLDEDSGGSAALDIEIDELLSRAGATR